MREINDVKSKKIGAMLRLTAVIAAVVMALSLSLPMLRKSSALGSVGRRSIAEMTPLSTAIAYYASGEIERLSSQSPLEGAAIERSLSGLLSQINTQQGYEQVYLLYRDGKKAIRYLEDGSDFSFSTYKPIKSIIDKIYTGKSVGDYATDLILREDGKNVAVSCLPIYGAGRTVLAVMVVEADPGNTGYHLLGPINLYYLGGITGLLLLLCVLLLYYGKRIKEARQQREKVDATPTPPKARPQDEQREQELLPEDDFQLPCDSISDPAEQQGAGQDDEASPSGEARSLPL